MSLSLDEVRYIAALARLRFSAVEEARMVAELSEVLDYMAKLNELDLTAVPPMSHVLDLYNVFREDTEAPRIDREQALRNAPEADEAHFRVPKVIE